MADYTKPYGRKFRAKMVQRMNGPGGESATGLSRKVGVPQATLSRWLREAGRVGCFAVYIHRGPRVVGGQDSSNTVSGRNRGRRGRSS